MKERKKEKKEMKKQMKKHRNKHMRGKGEKEVEEEEKEEVWNIETGGKPFGLTEVSAIGQGTNHSQIAAGVTDKNKTDPLHTDIDIDVPMLGSFQPHLYLSLACWYTNLTFSHSLAFCVVVTESES